MALGDVSDGLVSIDRYPFGYAADTLSGATPPWEVLALLANGAQDECLSFSPDAEATLDGERMDLVERGGWNSYLGGCIPARFAATVSLDPTSERSVWVVEDRGDVAEFTISQLRTEHTVAWEDPADGVLVANTPATLRWAPDAGNTPPDPSVYFALEGGVIDWTTPAAANGPTASLTLPDVCASGRHFAVPPWLDLVVEAGDDRFPHAFASAGLPWHVVDIEAQPDAPACVVDVWDLDSGTVPTGTRIQLDTVGVYSPLAADGFFVEGAWVSVADDAVVDVTMGEFVDLVGAWTVQDREGFAVESIVWESSTPTPPPDPYAAEWIFALGAALFPADVQMPHDNERWQGKLVHLVAPEVDALIEGGLRTTEGIVVSDLFVDPSDTPIGTGASVDYLAGIWHYDDGWKLVPRVPEDYFVLTTGP